MKEVIIDGMRYMPEPTWKKYAPEPDPLAEVKAAELGGKYIQCRLRDPRMEWRDKSRLETFAPGVFEYRIKPEKKPDVVWYTQVFSGGLSHVSSPWPFDTANLRAHFDGETGKLIKAEVLDQPRISRRSGRAGG